MRGETRTATVLPDMSTPKTVHTTTGSQHGSVPQHASECKACAYSEKHGWWGPGLPAEIHCQDCHRYWRSNREAHCAACCRHFASNAAFDAHRIGDTCNDPETLTRQDGRIRFSARDGRLGRTWCLVNYRELPDFDALG